MTRTEKAQQRAAARERIARAQNEARAHVARGTCPLCGRRLRHNLALTGWWMCGAHGEPSFRLPEYRDQAGCEFQCFTE